MDIDEVVLVSVDDHVVEPPGMFDGRVPAKYADLAEIDAIFARHCVNTMPDYWIEGA